MCIYVARFARQFYLRRGARVKPCVYTCSFVGGGGRRHGSARGGGCIKIYARGGDDRVRSTVVCAPTWSGVTRAIPLLENIPVVPRRSSSRGTRASSRRKAASFLSLFLKYRNYFDPAPPPRSSCAAPPLTFSLFPGGPRPPSLSVARFAVRALRRCKSSFDNSSFGYDEFEAATAQAYGKAFNRNRPYVFLRNWLYRTELPPALRPSRLALPPPPRRCS